MGLFTPTSNIQRIFTEKNDDKLVPSSKDTNKDDSDEPKLPEDNNNKDSSTEPKLPEDDTPAKNAETDTDNNDPVLPEEDDTDKHDPTQTDSGDINTTDSGDEPKLPEDDDNNDDGTTDSDSFGSEDDSTNDEENEEQTSDDKIKDLEGELFANLDTEDIAIKNKELKTKYFDLYDSTVSLIDRINIIQRTEQNQDILNFAATKISELRQLILDYTTTVYSRRSYMENAINFSQYLAVLSGINKLIQQIPLPEET